MNNGDVHPTRVNTTDEWLAPMRLPTTKTLLALLDQLQDAVFVIENAQFVFVNRRLTELFGYPEGELLGKPVFQFVHEDDREMVRERYQARVQGEDVVHEYQYRIVTGTGDVRHVNMRVALVENDEGGGVSLGSLHDITETKNTMRALADSKADIVSILNNFPDVFYRTDMSGIITLMSPSSVDAIGYTPDEMVGRPMADFYCNSSDREAVVKTLNEGVGKACQVEACMRHKDGSPIWVSTNAYVRHDDDGQPMCVEGVARNITERKHFEERLQHLATHDSLTGLPTRWLCMDFIDKAMAIARRHKTKAAVLFLDLNNFKTVNDTLGHEVGDQLLIQVGRRLVGSVREMDTVSRLGGDEFIVVLDNIETHEDVRGVAEKLVAAVCVPYEIGEHEVSTGISIGIALYPDDGEDAEHLVQKADGAMYVAKKGQAEGYYFVTGS